MPTPISARRPPQRDDQKSDARDPCSAFRATAPLEEDRFQRATRQTPSLFCEVPRRSALLNVITVAALSPPLMLPALMSHDFRFDLIVSHFPLPIAPVFTLNFAGDAAPWR